MNTITRTTSYLTAKDLFCGYGGWTTAAKSVGVEVKFALNHWDHAIKVHGINHPGTAHYCGDVKDTNPRRHPKTRTFIGSPACTDFTQAKGVKQYLERDYQLTLWEIKELERRVAAHQKRATMFDVLRFAEYNRYEMMFIENVVEVHKWDGFQFWIKDLLNMGYNFKFLYLNSMFFHELNGVKGLPPIPQSRDRWYCVAWRNDIPTPDLDFRPLAPCPNCGNVRARQIWKNPKKKPWGKYGIERGQYYYGCPACLEKHKGQYRPLPIHPYYYAGINAVDFRIPIQKVGDPERRSKVSDRTRERIKAGIAKYFGTPILTHAQHDRVTRYKSALLSPLYTQTTGSNHGIAFSNHTGNVMKHLNSEPLMTQKASVDYTLALLSASGYSNKIPREAIAPLHTQTTKEDLVLILVNTTHPQGAHNGHVRHGLEPHPTATTADTQSVAFVEMYGAGTIRPSTAPINTQTAGGGKTGVIFHTYNNNSVITGPVDALPTATTVDRHGMSVIKDDIDVEEVYYRSLRSRYELGSGEIVSETRQIMGFPKEYDISEGRAKDTTKGFGNAITPGVGEWLIKQGIKVLK